MFSKKSPPDAALAPSGTLTVWRMLVAQLCSIPATLITYPIVGGVMILPFMGLEWLAPNEPANTALRIAAVLTALFPFGFLLAAWQRLFLMRWISRPKTWWISGGLAGILLLGGVLLLTTRMTFPPPPRISYTIPAAIEKQVVTDILNWSLLGGALVGMVVGLLMGLVQGRLLPENRRAWWIVSALAWGLVAALILAFINVSTLYSVNSD